MIYYIYYTQQIDLSQDLFMPFPTFSRILSLISWLIVIITISAVIYLTVINIMSLQSNAKNISARFVSLIENPTQIITEAEKDELQLITQASFFNQWGYENQIKQMRRVSQGNPIQISEVEYTSDRKQYAVVTLTFENDLQNERSKKATLYLEKTGNWYYQGVKWKIYQIDPPQEDTLTDSAKTLLDQARDALNQNTTRAQEGLQSIELPFGQQ